MTTRSRFARCLLVGLVLLGLALARAPRPAQPRYVHPVLKLRHGEKLPKRGAEPKLVAEPGSGVTR